MSEEEFANGWKEYSKLVLSELKRLDQNQKDQFEKLEIISRQIAVLQIKSSLWGAVAGTVPAIGAVLFILLR